VTSFKFLHAADIHLDSPLRGLVRYEGVPVDQVRLATRTALNNLVEFAIDEHVAFLVIAGDLYDGDWDHFGTGLFFCGAMRRLNEAGIDVYIVLGNHDADSLQTKRLPLPSNVRVFAHKVPETFTHEATRTALHGQSYKDRDPGGNLAAAYPAARSGCFNIGVLHTALTGGRPPHAPYAPCTPADLVSRGYDYWALGHVHDREVVSTDPYIVFSGNLQGRSIRECGPKGAFLVTVQNDAVSEVRAVALDTVRWTHIEIDISSCSDLAQIEARLDEMLAAAYGLQAEGRSMIARVTLRGQTELHGTLVRRQDILREEVRAIAANISDALWIEKVKVATEHLGENRTSQVGGDDVALLLDEEVTNAELHRKLTEDFGVLVARMPPDLGNDSELISAIRHKDYRSLLKDATASLKARLNETVS
jgi:DNA repair exonuclease SbcCD nuclease subunit